MWFQRASDVVRKLRLGDIDLGIVGYDMFSEIGDEDRWVMTGFMRLGVGCACVVPPAAGCSQLLENEEPWQACSFSSASPADVHTAPAPAPPACVSTTATTSLRAHATASND